MRTVWRTGLAAISSVLIGVDRWRFLAPAVVVIFSHGCAQIDCTCASQKNRIDIRG